MTTEREYQERRRRHPSFRSAPLPRRRRGNPWGTWACVLFLAAVAFLTARPTWLNNQVLPHLLQALAQGDWDKLPAPPSVILTKRVANPTPGATAALDTARGLELDRVASGLVYEGDSVEELANRLRPHAQTEGEKARLIYSWIGQHIGYDVALAERKTGRDLRPETTLRKKETICSGYAYLYQELAKELGIEAVIVEGYGRGGSSLVGDDPEVNHAWNAVKIGTGWHLLDVTWGAGSVNNDQFQRRYSPYYFATAPQQLIYSHFPRESQWQLLSAPYDRAAFDSLPQISPRFFQDRLALNAQVTSTLTLAGNGSLAISAPETVQLSAQLRTPDGEELSSEYILIQRRGTQATVNLAAPGVGAFQLILFSKRPQEELYQQALILNLEASKAGTPFPTTFGTFNEKQAYLQQPLTQTLPLYHSAYFQLQVKGARQVMVLNQETQEWTALDRHGDYFTGTSLIKPGKTQVLARFDEGNRYWSLLEYN
ncbi:MAG: transglutaminase domain-containing protein [Cyanobacteriota bacterium]|jgi:transglutaminase/protease-like cytokinesis protein 3